MGAPVAEEIGAAPFLAVPAANAAERQIARYEEGATLEEIYAEQVRPKEPVVLSPSEPTPEELLDAVRKMKVSDLLLSTAATLAQLGFAKLDESTRDLEQARLAIEGMKALLGALEGAVPGRGTPRLQPGRGELAGGVRRRHRIGLSQFARSRVRMLHSALKER